MSFDRLINPIPIVIHEEIQQQEIYAVRQDFDTKSYALIRAPNRKRKDGRINCEGLYEDGVVAVSVSPINPKFRTQIEDGVWPFIEVLIDKNYFTVSSCEGHNDRGDYFYFTIVNPYLEEITEVINDIKNIRGIEFLIRDTMANIEIDTDKNGVKKVIRKQSTDYKKEYDDINSMFLRNYEKYYFLDVKLFVNGHRKENKYEWLKRLILSPISKRKLLKKLKTIKTSKA